jgi:hypothetical protein
MFEAAAFGGLLLCEQLAKVLELKLPAAAIVPPLPWRCRHICRGRRQLSLIPQTCIFYLRTDGMTTVLFCKQTQRMLEFQRSVTIGDSNLPAGEIVSSRSLVSLLRVVCFQASKHTVTHNAMPNAHVLKSASSQLFRTLHDISTWHFKKGRRAFLLEARSCRHFRCSNSIASSFPPLFYTQLAYAHPQAFVTTYGMPSEAVAAAIRTRAQYLIEGYPGQSQRLYPLGDYSIA